MSRSPFETGADLYREIQRRGLELRRDHGRDNALFAELCSELGCVDSRLMEHLKHHAITAEEFLVAFLKLAAPFATMFQELWSFLASASATRAPDDQMLRVRFGFEGESPEGIDLEQFREWAETARRLQNTYRSSWSVDAFRSLFEVLKPILPYVNQLGNYRYGYYVPGKPFSLPAVTGREDEFTGMVRRVRGALDAVILARLRPSQSSRTPSELRHDPVEVPEQIMLLGSLLTDLIPGWCPIIDHQERVPGQMRRQALEAFREHVEHRLVRTTAQEEQLIREPLDILDLPFWRERWRTYEVWATVRTLEVLGDYRPRLRVVEGGIPFDGPLGTILADLLAQDVPGACLAIQHETPFQRPPRRAIRPDVCVCFDSQVLPTSSAAVIELKQRVRLSADHVREVGEAYRDGSPRAEGVIILNYDDNVPALSLPNIEIIGSLRPDNAPGLERYADALHAILRKAGLRPNQAAAVTLLDVSGSMAAAYETPDAQAGLRALMDLPGVQVFRFNDGLQLEGDISNYGPAISIRTSGGTDLARTIRQLQERIAPSTPDRVLIVTDGGYGEATAELRMIPNSFQCTPEQLMRGIRWLVESEVSSRRA